MVSTVQSPSETQWIDELVQEARRDIVFLWHITGARFGGVSYPAAELPAAIERIALSMLDQGCVVGFGDPDSANWRVPTALNVPIRARAHSIAELWASNPEQAEFLVFALR